MKKICIFLGSLDGIGGTGRAVSVLANSLCDRYDISIVCYYQDLQEVKYSVDKKIKIYSIYSKHRSMTKGIVGVIRYLYLFFMKNHIQTVLACGAIYMPGCVIAGKLANVKVICCDHSNYTCVYDAKFERESRNFAARFSDYLITLTEKDVRNYKNSTTVRANIVAIPNIIEDALTQEYRNIVYNSSSKRIISVGRLTYAKNYELLIKVAKIILDQNPEWSWDIYGEGELRQVLEKSISEYNVERLTLKGNVKNIYELYREYAFLVMTSRYEGFPMVLIEAMANKLPCIAFDCQTGPSDIIIGNENGFLIEPENFDQMVKMIQKMIDEVSTRKYLSANTYIILEKYQKEKILDKWYKIL